MLHRLTLAAAAFLAIHAGQARGDEPKIKIEFDVVYAKPGGVELKLDIARPVEGDGPFPAVVVIHGGGWRQGDKADNRGVLAILAKRGYVAISPQYRFCPTHQFPAQVYDVKAAVRWLRVHKGDYKVDPDQIGAVGFSAGGHLSLMLGMTAPGDGLEGEVASDAPSSRVQAVVNFFGPTDFNAKDVPDITEGIVKEFLGALPADRPDVAAKASPLTYLTADDPPILTFQGTKDPLVPPTQAEALTRKMAALGVAGRTELLVGAGHGWPPPELVRTLDATVVFFDQNLKSKVKPKSR